jgi:flavin-dependent dehydrogenase
MNFDVVIVGAGPAGLSAAIVLARHQIRTLLCEAAALPVDKPCGEGLMPRGIEHCARLGVPRYELSVIGQPIAGVRYISPSGRVAEARFPDGPALGIRRPLLMSALLAQAERLRTLTLAQQTPVRLVRRGLRLGVGIDGWVVEPRLIIGADGVNSIIRKEADIPYRVVEPLRYGRRRHYRVASAPDLVEVHWAERSEAYITPTAPNQINIAFLWDREACLPDKEPCRDPRFLQRFRELVHELGQAEPDTLPRASGPMHHDVLVPACDGLLLLGDAAGYVDAVTGDGVALALEQSLLLEQYVVPRLRSMSEGQILGLRALGRYLGAMDQARSHNRLLTRWLLRIKRRPELLERVIASLSADPKLFQFFLGSAEGKVSPLRAPLASAAKLLLGLARRRGGNGTATRHP